MSGVIRKARTSDVPAMQRLVNFFADRGEMLHRSLAQFYENLRDFSVAEEDGEVVGCVALHVLWRDLAEIKSLAVAEKAQGKGYGKQLVRTCLQEAPHLGVERVFALTYIPQFFERLGFRVCDRAELPRKVWTECVYCPKFHDCQEVAVIIDLRPKG
jgi:amino-acid N-acetyltransferase